MIFTFARKKEFRMFTTFCLALAIGSFLAGWPAWTTGIFSAGVLLGMSGQRRR